MSELQAHPTVDAVPVPAEDAPRRRPRPGAGALLHDAASPAGMARAARNLPASVSGRAEIVGFRGLARLTASTVWRTVTWVTRSSVDSATELVKEVGSGEPILEIVDSRVEAVRSVAWRALGLQESTTVHGVPEQFAPRRSGYTDLRKQGDELLARSTDPDAQPPDKHPAFSRILRELTPDEGRILRFMALAGPQPAIDVRTKTPFGVGSERVAGGINLIADMAGCRYPDRNQQYLANLNRLGMIRFSEEQVDDPRRYSFIEAQPVAAEAMARVKKAVTVYRSIYLSLFGHQFCQVCFTLDGYDAGGWIRDVR